MALQSAIFTHESGERVEIKRKDIKTYHGTDYPTDNGTVIYFKNDTETRVKEDFSVVDGVFDL